VLVVLVGVFLATAGLFPLVRLGTLPLVGTLGLLSGLGAAVAVLFGLAQQRQAYQLIGAVLLAGAGAAAAWTELEYTYRAISGLDYFIWWSAIGMMFLFAWRGVKFAGRAFWALLMVIIAGWLLEYGRDVGVDYYEPLIVIAEDVSAEHAVLDEFVARYEDAKAMGVDVSAGIGDLYDDGEDNALAMLAEKDRHFYEYAIAVGTKATETKKHLEAYEEDAKQAEPGLREIRQVIVLLQQAQEIFSKEEALLAAQFQLQDAEGDREQEQAVTKEINRLRAQLRQMKRGQIEKAQDLITNPEAMAALSADGGRLYRQQGKKERSVAAEDGDDLVQEASDEAEEVAVAVIPDSAKWLMEPEQYLAVTTVLRLSNDLQRFLLYVVLFAALASYLNGWSRPMARWQPLPLASRLQAAYWPADVGTVLASDDPEDLRQFLQQSYEKGESWLCFSSQPAFEPESDLKWQRPGLPLAIGVGLYGLSMVWVFLALLSQGALQIVPATFMLVALALWGGIAAVLLKRCRWHLSTENSDFVADADLLIESVWHGRYAVSINDPSIARQLLIDLMATLRNRQGPRAVAWRTVNIVWALPQVPPAPMLAELLRLADRQNLRLVMVGSQAELPHHPGRITSMLTHDDFAALAAAPAIS
jgi:hypothetical protein